HSGSQAFSDVTSVQLGTGGTGWLRRRRLVQPGPDSEGEQALLRRLGDLGHRHGHLLRDGAFARIAGRAHCPTSQRAHTCCTLRMLPAASMGRGNVKLGLVFTHTLSFAPLREVPALPRLAGRCAWSVSIPCRGRLCSPLSYPGLVFSTAPSGASAR